MHRQHVDDVGPVVAMSVAVAEQLRGDRVTVSLVADQDVAEVSASRLIKAGKKVKAGAGTPVSRGADVS
jgi:hypothetical protein